MGKTIRASALILLLAYSAQAGDMQNDVIKPPPPPASATAQDGDMHFPKASEDTTSADPASEIMLTLLSGMLALF